MGRYPNKRSYIQTVVISGMDKIKDRANGMTMFSTPLCNKINDIQPQNENFENPNPPNPLISLTFPMFFLSHGGGRGMA